MSRGDGLGLQDGVARVVGELVGARKTRHIRLWWDVGGRSGPLWQSEAWPIMSKIVLLDPPGGPPDPEDINHSSSTLSDSMFVSFGILTVLAFRQNP